MALENGKVIQLDSYGQVGEFIMDTFSDTFVTDRAVIEARYHHNTKYKDAPSVVENGILSLIELHNLGIRRFTDKELTIFGDTDSHINGISCVSLAVVGLTDLYRDELEYDPYAFEKVDILVDSSVKARRNATHYGNEFLVDRLIQPEKLRAIDIRMIKLMESIKLNEAIGNKKIDHLIENFNSLREIAKAIKDNGRDIPLREMSYGNMVMDIDKVSDYPEIRMKR